MTTNTGAAAKVAAYLNRLNPVPAFPDYTGPYKVGTVDVEIPVTDLASPSPAPANAAGIHTVQFRIFYPADPDATGKRISWLPTPQRSYVSAYTQFLGIGPVLAEFISFLPRHLHYTTIPVLKNAALHGQPPASATTTTDGPPRWPTMVFSHGLGGSRNAYSHVAGSIASYGVVVVCPEHRDGSAVVSYVRDPAAQDRFLPQSRRRVVPYHRIPHTETPDVWAARDQQLRIRLWELGLVHDALLRIDEGVRGPADGFTNLNASTPAAALAQFAGRLDVQRPGAIVWAGHSFGATSVVQLLKTTYYCSTTPEDDRLYTPAADSRLRAQITACNPVILLDMWCFPLLSPTQRALFDRPLPAYDATAGAGDAPGGAAVLAVASESFYKWTAHLHTTAKVLSPDPAAAVAFAETAAPRPPWPEPHVFYVAHSAHLNQSDFGLLFPWLTKKVFGAEQPERALRLNVRAVLQLLRTNGVPVARTQAVDLVEGGGACPAKTTPDSDSQSDDSVAATDLTDTDHDNDDPAILARRTPGAVDCWVWIDLVGLGAAAADAAAQKPLGSPVAALVDAEAIDEDEEAMEGEMEPHLAALPPSTPVTPMSATARTTPKTRSATPPTLATPNAPPSASAAIAA
ncbi:platelet-activating factor acetylhydrolase precursor [Niveomyces insectorum RCEF 264]|uniref:Putative phospholipase n=1 Tax=Niveomyces insectorum RCEF 264 TaxID=1081102 RepID=A0A167S1L3_9HYPO|nr:platelet-activating factor acetylhydrolase precursor [Niveomyces insectorum RCEF 264]